MPHHDIHSLHWLVLLVHVELSQTVGQWTFVLELRTQASSSQALIPLTSIRTSKRAPWVSNHSGLKEDTFQKENDNEKRKHTQTSEPA